MVKEGDKIAVCISGGKDSMLLAKCMQELKKHRQVNFEFVFLVMDPGYNPINRQKIISNAKLLNIPITMFESNIFEVVEKIDDHPCYICARMRRGYLYKKAQELGCNKIALGHHFDDVVETILMGMLYGAQMQTMMPKLHSTYHEGIKQESKDISLGSKKYLERHFRDFRQKAKQDEICDADEFGIEDLFESDGPEEISLDFSINLIETVPEKTEKSEYRIVSK